MEGNGKLVGDLIKILDMHPKIRNQIQILLTANKPVWETNQALIRLNVRYIGESSIYFWFTDLWDGSGFTVQKKNFNIERLEEAVNNIRKKHVRIRFESNTSPTPVS